MKSLDFPRQNSKWYEKLVVSIMIPNLRQDNFQGF